MRSLQTRRGENNIPLVSAPSGLSGIRAVPRSLSTCCCPASADTEARRSHLKHGARSQTLATTQPRRQQPKVRHISSTEFVSHSSVMCVTVTHAHQPSNQSNLETNVPRAMPASLWQENIGLCPRNDYFLIILSGRQTKHNLFSILTPKERTHTEREKEGEQRRTKYSNTLR